MTAASRSTARRKSYSKANVRTRALIGLLVFTVGAPLFVLFYGVKLFVEGAPDTLGFSLRMIATGKTCPSAETAQLKYRAGGVFNVLAVTVGAPLQILLIGVGEYRREILSDVSYMARVLRRGKF